MTEERTQPRRIGPYRVVACLGEGGMGIVYRAEASSGESVALKVLRAALTSPALVRRFEREAQIRIEHPNVVRVLDAGVDEEGTPYIAFELLEGETLAERLSRGSIAEDELVRIAIEACGGLAQAHARGIVHRDLKPSNIFLCAGGPVKILDFGIALVDTGPASTRLTQTGGVPGTIGYLSPEQASGVPLADARSDVWSIGAVLYEGLTGAPPFAQASPLATVVATLIGELVPVRSRAPDASPELAAVVERALSRAPADRFGDAVELGAALAAVSDASRGSAARAERSSARPGPASGSIRPGERRVVAVVLAHGMHDRSSVERAIERAGGVSLRLVGDRAIGLFGGASWEGDELERAARAAMAIRAHAERVSMSSGWATGAGDRLDGEALASAERCNVDGLAGVALDAHAARALSDAFSVREVGRGVWELGHEDAVRQSTADSALPTVDRTAELAQLSAALRAVRADRQPLVVLVVGLAGIGKSHLRREMARLARSEGGATVWSASATRQMRGAELALVRALAESVDRAPPEIARADDARIAALARDDVAVNRDRARIAALAWLEREARRAEGALVLLVEDLHWADDASVELLEELVDRLAGAPLLVLATARPEMDAEPFAGRDVVRIEPRGLSRADAVTLAALAAGRALPERIAHAIAERTDGNPLFVIQTVRALAEEGQLDAELDTLRLPVTVEAVVQSRLDRLPEGERDLCRRGAVWARPFTLDEVRALGAGTGEGDAALVDALLRRDLLARRGGRRAGVFHFRSALVGEVAYQSLAPERASELHRKAARHLATDPSADREERARHHDLAGEHEAASSGYVDAAAEAVQRGDTTTALRCSERALALGVDASRRFELHALRVDAMRFLGRREELGRELEAALASAQSDSDKARALSERAVWLWRAGSAEQAIESADEALRVARASGDQEALVLARGRQFLVLNQAGDSRRAEEALEEAVTRSTGTRPLLRAMALGWRAHHLATGGDLGKRLDAFVELSELHAEMGDLRRAAGARANLADAYNRLGAYAEAAEALEAAIDDCRRVGHRTMEGYAQLNLGYARARGGDVEAALAALAEADRIGRDTGEARLVLLVGAYRARALLACGRTSEALALADETSIAAERERARDVAVGACTVAAMAALRAGDAQGAVERSGRALELWAQIGGVEEDEADVFRARADALEATGRADEAADARRRGRERIEHTARGIADEMLRARFLAAQGEL